MTAIKRDLLRVSAERKKISVLSRLRLSLICQSGIQRLQTSRQKGTCTAECHKHTSDKRSHAIK